MMGADHVLQTHQADGSRRLPHDPIFLIAICSGISTLARSFLTFSESQKVAQLHRYLSSIKLVGELPSVLSSQIVALHTDCATIVRHMLNASDYSPEFLTALCSIDHVLGLLQAGLDAGPFPHINYKGFGACNACVDLRPFWITECGAGMNAFHCDKTHKEWLAWTLGRPGMFPRFYHMLSPHLAELTCSPPSLSSSDTKRSPLPSEYARASAGTQAMMASTEKVHGDWMLYLSQMHCAPGMRVQRSVWALADGIRRVYTEREARSGR